MQINNVIGNTFRLDFWMMKVQFDFLFLSNRSFGENLQYVHFSYYITICRLK